MITDTDNDSRCTSGDYITAHKCNIGIIRHTVLMWAYMRDLFNRFTFSGKACLADK